MNNSTVNKIISTIQFTIYSFLAFIVFIIITSLALLSYGISLPHLSLPHFEAKQLYIKLDKKLIFYAKEINVTISNSKESGPSLSEIPNFSPIINLARKNFSAFKIDALAINQHKVTFSYTDTPHKAEDNSFRFSNEQIEAYTTYTVHKEHVYFQLKNFIHKPSDVTIHAQAIYDFETELSYADINLSLSSCGADVNLVVKENAKKAAFVASSNRLSDIAPIVQLFELEPYIYKWIVPYNDADSYQLINAHGIYEYSNSDTILHTLKIHAQEIEPSYTFNQSLYPVEADYADVYFNQGVLRIQPHKAAYNERFLDKGDVRIDFNPKHITLRVDLFANLTLDKDIVDIAQAYHITLPVLQENGTTNTHLNLVVDLETEDAYATGQFFIKSSDIYINKVPYKIHNTAIRLHKNILTIDTAKIQYKDVLYSELTGQIDLKSLMGDFYFDIDSLAFALNSEESLKLLTSNPRLQLHLGKKEHSYIIPKTRWAFRDYNISLAANEVFMTSKFSSIAKINQLNLKVDDLLEFNTSGIYDIANNNADMDINLSHFHLQEEDLNVTIKELPLALKLNYLDDTVRFTLPSEKTLLVNNNSIQIKPTHMLFDKGELILNPTHVIINNDISTYLSTQYELGSNNIQVQAEKTLLLDKELLYIEPKFEFLYHYVKGLHYLDIPKHGLHAVLNAQKVFDLKIKDFSKLRPYSKVMQHYDIKEGQAKLTVIDDRIGMDIRIDNFYPLLSENGKDITHYYIKGEYQNQTANLQVNHKIDFLYRNKAKVMAKDINFNLFPILEYLELIDTKDDNNSLDLIVKTKRCNVSLGHTGRKILSDTINMQIHNSTVQAQLIHQDGGVLFESKDNNMSIHGRGLNDTFMNELFKFSTFKGGKLSFVMQGPFDDMDGIINIKDTIIEDYTVLNNTLAFFNTIPALVTFSVPDYSKNGLHVKQMYGSFHKEKNIIKVQEAKISSKELTITSQGKSDLENETIDILMQVKTDIGSSAKDIPLLGYIIFGDDSVSTTVRVHGSLNNPKVENSVAKSIIVAPYNILKRTLSLPFLPFLNSDEKNSTTPPSPLK